MKSKKVFNAVLNNQRGSVIVLLAVCVTALFGITALVADVGVNYVKQTQLTIAADAAALAGGSRLDDGRDVVAATARATAEKNGVSSEMIIVEVSENGNGITVRTQAPVQLFFAKLFGANGGTMEQRARVAKTRPTALFNVFPLGVDKKITLDYTKLVNFFSSELLGSGNWGALAFADENGKYDTGASVLRANLKDGYPGLVELDDIAATSGGVSMGPIRDAITYRFGQAALTHQCSLGNCPTGCPRILIMPIYEEIMDNNNNKTSRVLIVDFAAFWVSSMSGSGSNTQIWGHFIRPHVRAAASVEGESGYGLTTTKLIQ